jgi:prepilin-type processing-associated H-X9-DG protein
VVTKTSGLAIAALVLAVLSPFACFITAIPAIILGIISLVQIEKSGGKLTGKGMAIAGIVVPVVLLPAIIMVAILMPALAQVKNQAKAVLCQSQLKQWGAAVSMYVSDYDGHFFDDRNWVEPLRPYFMEEVMLLCPMATKSEDEGGRIPFAAWVSRDLRGSYGLNYWVISAAQGQTIGPSKPEYHWGHANVKGAGNIPLFSDCSSPGVWPLHSDNPPEYDGQPKNEGTDGNEMRDCCINRHSKRINMLFVDYSVTNIGLKHLWMLKWHRSYPVDDPPPDWPEWMEDF